MRTLKAWSCVAACVAAYAAPNLVGAQQSAADAPPPPQMEKLEEGQPPEITIRKPEQRSKITEKRAPGGKVIETKVTNGKSTYYLKPNDQAGSALPGDTQSTGNRGAQWQVKEFDLGREEVKEVQTSQTTSVPAPPAPPATPVKK